MVVAPLTPFRLRGVAIGCPRNQVRASAPAVKSAGNLYSVRLLAFSPLCCQRMALTINLAQRRLLQRVGYGVIAIVFLRYMFMGSSDPKHVIKEHNVLERVTLADKTLDVQRHPFLQARMGRDDRDDIMAGWVRNGVRDYWDRFQKPL